MQAEKFQRLLSGPLLQSPFKADLIPRHCGGLTFCSFGRISTRNVGFADFARSLCPSCVPPVFELLGAGGRGH